MLLGDFTDANDWPAEADEFTKTLRGRQTFDERVRPGVASEAHPGTARYLRYESYMRDRCPIEQPDGRRVLPAPGMSLTQSLSTSQQTVWRSAYDRDGR